ncbi:MAG: protein-methionine-sulfoxide reductase catalytic subunit MsrP [Nitrospinae bacterium]|nr:protein-methionine-sulfoxide reductase catalytic subunit MsrP [Nitrospinota bacterium]
MFTIQKPWQLSENQATPEDIYLNRRAFLRQMGLAGMGAAVIAGVPLIPGQPEARDDTAGSSSGNQEEATPEALVTGYNNFYEFGTVKNDIKELAAAMNTDRWTIQVGGLVKNPRTLDADELLKKFSSEERVYRLRCVEAWSMVIPWTGFPLAEWIKSLEPLSSARYVKFTTFLNPNIASGQKDRFWEPWPYTDGLTLKEAMNELSFMATGLYGKSLTPQNGAPLRLVVPWKYGFKSIKSIVKIEFTKEEPETFWQTMSPLEYDFYANVRPEAPYARWQQEYERVVGKGDRIKTRPFNGYEEQVAHLYL